MHIIVVTIIIQCWSSCNLHG